MALAARIDALKPRGRVQRAVQLTKAERRELKTEQQRKSRAQDKQLEEQAQHFMAQLGRYDLPLVQLLMAEYALNPASAGAPGQMRLHFLEQYAATCHTKHAEPAASVHELAVLAAVLRIHKPARDLLAMRLAATIGLTVQSWPSTSRRRSSTTGSRMAASCAPTTMCSWPSTRR